MTETCKTASGNLSRSARALASSTSFTNRSGASGSCVLSIPTFLSDDVEAARSAARYNLAFFGQLPNYRRQWRRAGFRAEMDRLRAHWTSGGGRRRR